NPRRFRVCFGCEREAQSRGHEREKSARVHASQQRANVCSKHGCPSCAKTAGRRGTQVSRQRPSNGIAMKCFGSSAFLQLQERSLCVPVLRRVCPFQNTAR